MKRVVIFFLFLLLPVFCRSEEKVYTNADIEQQSPNTSNSKHPAIPSTQRNVPPAKEGRDITGEVFERKDSAFQSPNNPNPQQSESHNQVNPFPGSPKGAIEQMLAEACARVTLFLLIVVGIPFLIWLICLIDILRHDFTGNNKIIWLLVVFFVPVIGAALYFFIGTDQKIRPEDDEEPVTRLI